MAEKKLSVSVIVGAEMHAFKFSPETKVSALLVTLIRKFSLPEMTEMREPIFYELIFVNRNLGLSLNEETTLVEAGVIEREVLRIARIDNQPVFSKGSQSANGAVGPIFKSELEALSVLNHNLILNTRAQNRTTHATRAIARFLYVQVVSLFAAGGLWAIAISSVDDYRCTNYGTECSGNDSIMVLALLVYVVGFFYSLFQFWKELQLSEISN